MMTLRYIFHLHLRDHELNGAHGFDVEVDL